MPEMPDESHVPPLDPDAPVAGEHLSRSARLREVALLFTRLGFTAFGGPPAHVAMMEDEIVRRRKWLDRQHFLDLYSAMNVIPGPNSTELAIALGHVRAGVPGLCVAGACFILPAVLIILPLAWAYARFGTMPEMTPVLLSVNAAVIAMLAAMFWRLATAAVKDRFTVVIAVASVASALVLGNHARLQPELIVLATSAFAGAIWYGRPRVGDGSPPLLLLAFPAVVELRDGASGKLFFAFLKIALTLYGSGYVLISYLRTTMVEQHGWITERELLDGIGVGQVTPGPILTTATFLGYLVGERAAGGHPAGGVAGALAATAGIFLPSFVLVGILGGVLHRIRRNRYVRGALDGMNAAVAALILVVTIQLAGATFGHPSLSAGWTLGLDPLLVAVTVVAALVLLRFDINTTWIIAGAAAVGVARGLWPL
jgi:chromate transporter